jgi:hypothetical protein
MPSNNLQASVVETLVVAEDDQEFLTKHKEFIEKDKGEGAKPRSLLQTLEGIPSGSASPVFFF